MMLAIGYVAAALGRTWQAKAAVAVFAAGAIGLFAFYYPLLAAVPVPKDAWQERLWVFDSSKACAKPTGKTTTATLTQTTGASTIVTTSVSNSNQDLPPKGWCWI
jgi:hypothetical protein